MTNSILMSPDKVLVFKPPELSEWQCYLFGTDNYVIRPLKGKHPNWFWRRMQYLCFGNKWIKTCR